MTNEITKLITGLKRVISETEPKILPENIPDADLKTEINALIENLITSPSTDSEQHALLKEAVDCLNKLYSQLDEWAKKKAQEVLASLDQQGLSEVEKLLIRTTTAKRRLAPELKDAEIKDINKQIYLSISMKILGYYIKILQEKLPKISVFDDEDSVFDIFCDKKISIEKSDKISDMHIGINVLSPDQIKYPKNIIKTAFETVQSRGRDFQGASLGKPKDSLSNSQKEFVDKWKKLQGDTNFPETQAILAELDKTKFLDQGLCNGFALLQLLNVLGYQVKDSKGDKISINDLLELSISSDTTKDKDISICIDLIRNLMEPKDLNPELRQHDLIGAIKELELRGMIVKESDKIQPLESTHVGVAYDAGLMGKFIDNYLNKDRGLRIGTAEHAIAIKKLPCGKFKIFDPNQNNLRAFEHLFDSANQCAKGLFELISPGAEKLWSEEKFPLALSLSLYGEDLPSEEQIHTDVPSMQEKDEDKLLRNYIARGANALMMAVTVNDLEGVKKYLEFFTPDMIHEQQDNGTDLKDFKDNALMRAVTLKYNDSAQLILNKLLGENLVDHAKFSIPDSHPISLNERLTPLLLYCLKKNNVELADKMIDSLIETADSSQATVALLTQAMIVAHKFKQGNIVAKVSSFLDSKANNLTRTELHLFREQADKERSRQWVAEGKTLALVPYFKS